MYNSKHVKNIDGLPENTERLHILECKDVYGFPIINTTITYKRSYNRDGSVVLPISELSQFLDTVHQFIDRGATF